MASLSKDSFRYYFKIKDWKPSSLNLVQAFKCIQKEERDRILRFHFKDDLKAALIGRLFLRKIINQQFKLKNNEIKLIRNEYGRPSLEIEDESIDDKIFNQNLKSKESNFDFNISHHGAYCVAVAENVRRIGVDVMRIEKRFNRDLDDYFRLMNKKFTLNEWNFINSIKLDEERLKRFMRMWTLKESFVKADGCGLTIDLRRLNFICKTGELKRNLITNDTQLEFDGKLLIDWKFIEYLLDQNYCVAIAIEKPNQDCNQFLDEIKFDQLIDNLDILDDNINNDLWTIYNEKENKN